MKNSILIDSDHGLTRVAVIEEGDLVEYYVEREGRCCMVGNVYVGRVQNVLPGMQAAFVDIGTDKNAFLYLGDEDTADASGYSFGKNADDAHRARIRTGQELLVQVVKEPEGQKGPRVTTHLTVPGRLLVLATDTTHIGISRRIEDEEERLRLAKAAADVCPEGMGMILRTAALGAEKEELEAEVRTLLAQWSVIERKARHAAPPKCIHREDSLLFRTVRDLFSCATQSMVIVGEQQYAAAREVVEASSPELLDRITLYEEATPLFDAMGVEEKAEKALSRHVWLRSGGYLVIDDAEAMTVVDVNSGKFTGKKDLQDTVFRVNMEAAKEVARQLRLRDIGGIIVIDFIDMEDEMRREELLVALREALRGDRNRTNVVGFTGLGLVEMTRRKTRLSLSRTVQRTCAACGGSGKALTPDQTARKALRAVRRRRASGDEQTYRLEAHTDVARAFERLGGAQGVRVMPREAPPEEDFVLTPWMETE